VLLPLPRIPIIEDLTSGPVPAGSWIIVEYAGASRWYEASLTVAAGWLKAGGNMHYVALGRSPDYIRSQLNRLGLNAEELENMGRLSIVDGFTASLGQKSREKLAFDSLKVADLSIFFSKNIVAGRFGEKSISGEDMLRIVDNGSIVARFNEEKTWVEVMLTRAIPSARTTENRVIVGVLKGLHSPWVYEQLEQAADGAIDFKLDEAADPPKNLMRIRMMRNIGFDGRWHQLCVGPNLEVTLKK